MSEPQEPITIRILWELDTASGSTPEIASILGVDLKTVAGTISNLKRDKKVKVTGASLSPKRGRGFLFSITARGRSYVRKYNRMVLS